MIAPLPPLLLRGDCLVELARIPDGSVDAVVTDPPYGLEFMGKAWDNFGGGFNGGGTSATRNAPTFTSEPNATCAKCGGRMRGAKSCACAEPDFRVKGEPTRRGGSNHAAMLAFEEWTAKWAAECLRILKPGGHLLAFGGSRTWHRLAAGIEDAGFEIRDSIAWLYGSGFPKSLDVSKAIDKAAGATREKVRKTGAASAYSANAGNDRPWMQEARENGFIEVDGDIPATDAAREWGGWGTALKPAFEPIVVARKPLGEKTVAANVLAHGTGALNIDATRIGTDGGTSGGRGGGMHQYDGFSTLAELRAAAERGEKRPRGQDARATLARVERNAADANVVETGRWPANVALDESQAAALDAQSGTLTSGANPKRRGADKGRTVLGEFAGQDDANPQRGVDSGGASRFFYVAKAPKSERPVVDGTAHPTVKPLALMRWLCRLVTPPGGIVVDPFAGSGTTLEAAYLEGFESIGVEMTPEYWPLIAARIERVTR